FGQRPHRVADPDHAVGGGGGDAGQQPRPPGFQRLAPGLPGDLALEEGGPVGDPPRITQRFLPAGTYRPAAARELLQPPHVHITPPLHPVCVPMAHHRLSRHRPMVGQPAIELRPGGVQPLVCLIKCPGHARFHWHLPKAPYPASPRPSLPPPAKPQGAAAGNFQESWLPGWVTIVRNELRSCCAACGLSRARNSRSASSLASVARRRTSRPVSVSSTTLRRRSSACGWRETRPLPSSASSSATIVVRSIPSRCAACC